MSNVFEFVAKSRDLSGTSAARAVRRSGNVPAVVYGGEAVPQSIVLDHNEVLKHLDHEAVYSHVLDLKVDGKSEKAILKGIQRHPAKAQILHMDFMRVDAAHVLKVHVPIHFLNAEECIGVKAGGVLTHAMVDVEVACLPESLPEYIEIDVAHLDISDSVHLSDLVLPEGVAIPVLAQGADHDHTVAQVVKVKGIKEDDAVEGDDVAAESDESE